MFAEGAMKFEHGYALIVGVGQSAYSAWSLPVTVKDAKVLVSVLTDPSLCAYPASDDHMRLLVDEGATRANIRHGLEWLAQCAKADREATVVVYFSGHGWTASKSGGYYLIPHDVNPFDIPASALSRVEFTGLLRGIDARRFLVFLDTCHAGGMATAKDDAALSLPQPFIQAGFPKDLARDLAQGQGRAVFASSRGDERSWVRRDRSMSIYTYHLVEALQGAGNRSGDTVVRLSNLVTHLSLTVPESARELGGARQTPFYDWSTEDFAVALVRGGKGLPAEGWQEPASGEQFAPSAYTATLTGSGAIAQDDSVAAGAGGIAIGRVGGDLSLGGKPNNQGDNDDAA